MSHRKSLDELIDEADEIFKNIKERKNSRDKYNQALLIAESENKQLEFEYIKGKLNLLDEKWKDAIEKFNKVLELDKKYFKAWNYRGMALLNLNNYKESINCFSKAIEINPEYAIAWNNKGVALEKLDRHEESLKFFESAINIDPEFTRALANKSIALSHLEDYTAALKNLSETINLKSDEAYLWRIKGVIYGGIKDYENALECHDNAIEIDSNYIKAYIGKSLILHELGNDDLALKIAEKATRIDDENTSEINANKSSAWSNYGYLLSLNEKFNEAISAFDEAIKFNPSNEFSKRSKKMVSNLISSNKKLNEIKKPLSPEDEEEKLKLTLRKEMIKILLDKQGDILKEKNKNEDAMNAPLKPRKEPISENFLMVLRRWNSYTPAMITQTESNLGGGYFIYWKGKGIVIDPGLDFLYNFLNNDFLVYDIDAVVITHAHIDHCDDFESILTLIFEYNDNIDKKIEKEKKSTSDDEKIDELKKQKKKIDVFMNLGTMKKTLGWLSINESNPNIKRIYPLEWDITHHLPNYSMDITATKAYHKEVIADNYSVGLKLELFDVNNKGEEISFNIGYTSDTRCETDIIEQYEDIDLLIVHLGSINDYDLNLGGEKDDNHLMLTGVYSIIYESNARIVIISEFGEELGKNRIHIANILNQVFEERDIKCLTGDIGLKIKIPDLTIKCKYCSFSSSKDVYIDKEDIIENMDPEKKKETGVVHYCNSAECERSYTIFSKLTNEEN